MAGLIPDHILDQIRQNNDIVEVIGSYFPLKRAGANFRALCPFHKEKTPSFNVNPQKQIWHCFGCGAGGNVFTFVMKYENAEFVDVVRRLAERAGIRLEFEDEPGARESRQDQKEALLKLHDQAAAFFHVQLMKEKSADPARAYLKKRAIGAETAKRWRLGYSPDAWDGLIQWAGEKKFPVELLELGGLVLRREGGEGFYDRFRGRLMFPICDEQGRVVGFSARILTDAKDQPKYVNSPETPIFQKGKILFALDRAKRAILEEKFAIVCEGQVDTISCHEAGLANVVAPQGTALTEQHARILKRYAEEVVLMFDADAAGQNAIVRSAEPLWEAGVAIRVAVLPQGHDPDSFVKEKGVEELRNLVTKAPGFFVYLLDRVSSQNDAKTDRGKLQITNQLAEWLVRIPSPILQSTYIQQTAARLEVPEDALRQELRKLQKTRHAGRVSPGEDADVSGAAEGPVGRPDALPAERMLLQCVLTDEQALETVARDLDAGWLTGSVAGGLIRRTTELYRANRWQGPDSLLGAGSDEEDQRMISGLLMAAPLGPAGAKAAADCLATLKRRALEGELQGLQRRLKAPGLSKTEMDGILQQIVDLRQKLDHIGALLMQTTKPSPR